MPLSSKTWAGGLSLWMTQKEYENEAKVNNEQKKHTKKMSSFHLRHE